MKKLMMLSLLSIGLLLSMPSYAQVHVSFNIGLQPAWGPVGYDYVQYYYIPDIDAYYDVNRHVYIYLDGGRWVTRGYLPPRYRDVDLYTVHKVVVNERNPWMHHDRDYRAYGNFRGRHDQTAIRDSHEERYYQNPGHPQYNNWKAQHHDNGNHGGGNNHGRGNEGHGHNR